MTTSPILWATGTLVALALSATLAGHRLASATRPGPASSPALAATVPGTAAAGDTGRILVVQADGRGHFTVHPRIEGTTVTMMVDTGATVVALTSEDAAAAGIRPLPRDFTRTVETANGAVAVAPVRIRELRLGDITVRDVEAVVIPAGRLGTSLLGMSFLRRLGGFDVARGRLTLRS